MCRYQRLFPFKTKTKHTAKESIKNHGAKLEAMLLVQMAQQKNKLLFLVKEKKKIYVNI